MSNSLSCNPVFIDVFSTDVTVFEGPGVVRSVIFNGRIASDRLVLTDGAGNWLVSLLCGSTSSSVIFAPTEALNTFGLVVSTSGSYSITGGGTVLMALIQI